jgi:putative SOS response-associated peptidase YedK
MCVRFSPLTAEEAQAVLDMRGRRGSHAIRYIEVPDPLHDARPGSQVPLFVPDASGSLAVRTLTWGFPLDGKPNAVFNTRIETALVQLERGRRGMWAKAIREGRCLVPVRAFYEGHMTEHVPSPVTGKPVKRQYRFRLPGARAFLLAAVQLDGMFSIVTTEPNESVAPVHNRMPLVLGPGESSVWLDSSFTSLVNKNRPELEVLPEDQGLSHLSVENVD